MKAINQYVDPILDERWDRSWAEWEQITEYSKVYGYHAASRKFFAIKDGKKIYLSRKHIEQKIKKVDEFNKTLEGMPGCLNYAMKLNEIVKNDDDIRKKYMELVKEYNEKQKQIIDELFHSYLSSSSKIYSHIYYCIRHYDNKE
jgi:hypothetical protein